MFAPESLLDLDHTDHRKLFENTVNAWEALKQIGSSLQFRLQPAIEGTLIGKPFISGAVFIGKGTIIEHGAMIKGPAWIGENCQIRNGCYVRENVIVGNGVIMGNSSEFKNSIIFNEAEIPHFNYVGDSIVGFKGHLAAGVILSNVRLDRAEITVTHNGSLIPTGLRKFGAIIGDRAEIGCNCVLSPGSIVGRNAVLYPGVQWRGIAPENSIVRIRQDFDIIPRRDK